MKKQARKVWLFMPAYDFYYLARYREKNKSLSTFMHLEMLSRQANHSSTPGKALSLLPLLLCLKNHNYLPSF